MKSTGPRASVFSTAGGAVSDGAGRDRKPGWKDAMDRWLRKGELVAQQRSAWFYLSWMDVAIIVGFSVASGLLMWPNPLFGVLPGLVLVALQVCRRYPRACYCFLIFVLPFGAFRGKIHWLVAALLIGLLVLADMRDRRLLHRLHSKLWFWVAAYLGVNIVSASLSHWEQFASIQVLKFVAVFGFLALGILLIDRKAYSQHLPLILVSSVAISCALAVVGFFWEIPFFASMEELKRGSGGSVSPISLSMAIVAATPYALYFYVRSPFWFGRLLGWFSLALFGMAMVTTISRGGLLLFIAAGGCFFVLYYRHLRFHQLLIVVLASVMCLASLIVFIPDTFWNRQRQMRDPEEDSSFNRRWAYLVVGYEAFREKPILGSGPNTFQKIWGGSSYAYQFMKRDEIERGAFERPAHNNYMDVLVGTGVLGLICFLMILWTAFRNFQRARKIFNRREQKELSIVTMVHLLCFCILCIYFLIQSDMFDKRLFFYLALSQAALNVAMRCPIPEEAALEDAKPVTV